MELGWESEGPGFKPQQAPSSNLGPQVVKKIPNYSQPKSVPLIKKFARHT